MFARVKELEDIEWGLLMNLRSVVTPSMLKKMWDCGMDGDEKGKEQIAK